MSGVLATVATGLCLFARTLPETGWTSGLAFVAGLLLTPLLASPFEWLVTAPYHRHLVPGLGRIYTIHHHSHHHVFFPTWRYVTAGPARRIPVLADGTETVSAGPLDNALLTATALRLLGLVLIVAPAWLATAHWVFIGGVLASLAVVSNLFITVHDTIHRPGSHPLIEVQPWFPFLDNHHYIHHVDTEANVNFLLPLADWLFGTLRRALDADEVRLHGTREAAKAQRVGVGEPARHAVRQARPVVAAGARTPHDPRRLPRRNQRAEA
jgi:hypothetical protein